VHEKLFLAIQKRMMLKKAGFTGSNFLQNVNTFPHYTTGIFC